jgi:Protein of unknown function (DUF1499)
MQQRTFNVLVVAVVAVAVVAATRWPRINVVETGRTPEYPELRDREYAASEAAVGRAAKAAVEALPGWSLVGAGQGRGGTAVQALATNPAPVKTEMTITIRRPAAKTVVHVRALSTFGPWDFGQGARHIEAFLSELDRQMANPAAKTP